MTGNEPEREGSRRPQRQRIFAALDLPVGAIDSIAAWQGQALGDRRLRPIDSHNLHLTLVFLGDCDRAEVERAVTVLTATASGSGLVPVRLRPEPIGLPPRRPRVIAFDAESDAATTLQRDLAARLREAGLGEPPGRPERPYRPHLSVARVRGDPPRGRAARDVVAGLASLGRAGHTFDAVRVALYRSELRSQGARYSALADVELPHRSGG